MENLILNCVASYGLEVTKTYPVLDQRDPLSGYGYSVVLGDGRGVREYRLVYDFLTTDPTATVTLDTGEVQTTFDYLRNFFDRHHYPEMKPFGAIDPETNERISLVFLEHARSFSYANYRTWRGSLRCGQWRAQDAVSELEMLSASNPHSI